MKITLHRCQITRARDLTRGWTDGALKYRMTAMQTKGEHAARAVALGGWGEDYEHASNKGAATSRTAPATVLKMCRIDYALARHILREREAA